MEIIVRRAAGLPAWSWLPRQRFQRLDAEADLLGRESEPGWQLHPAAAKLSGHGPVAVEAREPGIGAAHGWLLAHRVEERAAVHAVLVQQLHHLVLRATEAVVDQHAEHPVHVAARRPLHRQRDVLEPRQGLEVRPRDLALARDG